MRQLCVMPSGRSTATLHLGLCTTTPTKNFWFPNPSTSLSIDGVFDFPCRLSWSFTFLVAHQLEPGSVDMVFLV